MRKIFFAILLFVAALVILPQKGAAQFRVKGGIYVPQFSKLKDYRDFKVKQNIGYQAGVAYQINILPVFTIQPELLFIQRDVEVSDRSGVEDTQKYQQKLIQVPVSIQYSINLLMARPYIQAVPYVNYLFDGKLTGGHNWKDSNKLTYGIGLGAGIDVWHLQLNIRYNLDISKVGGKQSNDPIYERYRVSKGKAYEVSLAYYF